jgi:CBS domain-containing protein
MPGQVCDVMEREPLTIGPDAAVADLVELLHKNDERSIPVVQADGKLVGIVSEADLVLQQERDKLRLPPFINIMGGVVFLEPLHGLEAKLRKAFAAKVADTMTTKVVTVGADAPIKEAARLIARSDHNRLPVVDERGHLDGIVTRLDLLRSLTS